MNCDTRREWRPFPMFVNVREMLENAQEFLKPMSLYKREEMKLFLYSKELMSVPQCHGEWLSSMFPTVEVCHCILQMLKKIGRAHV